MKPSKQTLFRRDLREEDRERKQWVEEKHVYRVINQDKENKVVPVDQILPGGTIKIWNQRLSLVYMHSFTNTVWSASRVSVGNICMWEDKCDDDEMRNKL